MDQCSVPLRPGAESSAQHSQQGAGGEKAVPAEMCETLLEEGWSLASNPDIHRET